MTDSAATLVPNISQIVAPVIMISACGLLCATLYSRLVAVATRIRDFQRERLKEIERFAAIREEDRETGVSAVSRIWLDELNAQLPRLMFRAIVTTVILILFLLCILCMILCSMVLAFNVLFPNLAVREGVPVGLFVFGAGLMVLGVVLALVELILAIQPLNGQHHFINKVQEIEVGWLFAKNIAERYSEKAPMLSQQDMPRLSHSVELGRMSI
jgi:hypothetical protein